MMKMSAVRDLSKDEISQKMAELKEKIFGLRAQKQLGKLEKPHQLKLLKKEFARLKTAETELQAGSKSI